MLCIVSLSHLTPGYGFQSSQALHFYFVFVRLFASFSLIQVSNFFFVMDESINENFWVFNVSRDVPCKYVPSAETLGDFFHFQNGAFNLWYL